VSETVGDEIVVKQAEPLKGVQFSSGYKRYALGLLMVVYVSNFLDRQILAMLLQPIKQDLGLSDTQLGVLSGVAFALFYATLGMPLARWADKHNRVTLISVSIAIWSCMTALCGAAGNFWQLLAARIGVGVGEAGCSPPAHSLIADYFEPGVRARAMSIYSLGIPLGTCLGYLLGGWINELYSWRIAFFCVGMPGLVLAVLVRLTLREPPRGHSEGIETGDEEAPPVMAVFRFLWQLKSFRHMALGTALLALGGYGAATWFPAFLMRTHGMSTGQIGSWLALIGGGSGVLGTLLGGYLGDKLGARDDRWYAWLPGLAIVLGIPFSIAALLSSSPFWTLVLLIPPSIAPAIHAGPVFSTVQRLAGLRMRAMAAAILFFIVNLIGLGLGPLVIGWVSDLLRGTYGDDSLRYTLLFGAGIGFWTAFHYLLSARTLREDLKALKA